MAVTITVTEVDAMTLRTLLAAAREHYATLAADDPEALDELLGDGDDLLRRMRGESAPTPPNDDLPL